ncbi:MAG: hypothetical protein LUG51_07605 [Tannerellaceae bacterium]|nr:hypothetical protein [Tannerellaceae bacterium]
MSNNINLEVNKMHHTSRNSNVGFPVWGTIVGDLNKQEDLMKLLSTLRKEDLKRVRLVSNSKMGKDMRFYSSLHAAVHAAKEGDLILIWEGVYNESVTINKDDLTLKALSSVAEHRGVQVTGQLAISACNVSLEGIEVTGKTTIATTGGKTVMNNMYLKGNTHITGQGEIYMEKSQVNNLDIQTLLYANVYLANCISTQGHSWAINSLTSTLTIEKCNYISLEHNAGEVMVFGSWFVAPHRDSYVIRSTAEAGKLFVFNSSARSKDAIRGKVNKTGACDYQFSTFNFNREDSVLTGKEIDPDFYITDYYTKDELDYLLNLKVDQTVFEQFQADNTGVIDALKEEVNTRIDDEVEELNETIRTLEEKVDANQSASDQRISDLDEKVESYKEATDQSIADLDSKVDVNKDATDQNIADLDTKVETYKESTDQSIADLENKVDANKDAAEQGLSVLETKVESYKELTDASITDLGARVDSNKTETDQSISSLDDKVEDYKEEIQTEISDLVVKAKAYKDSNDQAVANLNDKVDTNREEIDQSVAALNNKVENYKENINTRITNFVEKAKIYQQSNDKAVADLDDKVDANKIACDQEMNDFKAETAGNFQNVQAEIDSLEARKVPYFDDKRILLDNHRNLLGLRTDGEGVNLAMVSQWDVADFGSATLPLNLNASERPTVQLAGQSGDDAEKIAFLKDVDAVQEVVEEMKEIAANLVHIEFEQVDELPVEGRSNIIYLVPHQSVNDRIDYYFEYVWLESTAKYASIGTTEIDLSGYYTKEESDILFSELNINIDEAIQDLSDNKQDKLIAGDNILIDGRKISAIDTIYDDSEVKGLIAALEEEVDKKADADTVYTKEDVDGKIDDVIAGQVDMSLYYKKTETDELLDEKQAQLTAGANIKIDENNQISAIDTVYDDSEVKGLIAALEEEVDKKADADTVYTKEDVDGKIDDVIAGQVDMSLYYKKTETDELLDEKQAQLTAGDNIEIDDDNKISAVDTIYDDTAICEQLEEVEKETERLQEDLESIEETLKLKADKESVYTKTEIDEELDTKQNKLVEGHNISLVQNGDGTVTINCNEFNSVKIVTELPESGKENVLYLLIQDGEDTTTIFEKYVWEEGVWVSQGDVAADVDLDSYYTKTETDLLLEEKANVGQLSNYLGKTENAASATKLVTARTLWGRSFNGEANVNGALEEVTTISASGNITTSAKFVGNLQGNADTATSATNATNATNATTAASAAKLTTARAINGVNFNGEGAITVPLKFPSTGITTLTSLNSVNIAANYDLRFTASANQTLSFAAGTDGAECIISIKNSAAATITITFPATNVQTDETSMTIAAGEIGEISVRYLFDKFVIKVI